MPEEGEPAVHFRSGEGRPPSHLDPHTPPTLVLAQGSAQVCPFLWLSVGGTTLNAAHRNTIQGHACDSKASKLMNLPKFVEFGARI